MSTVKPDELALFKDNLLNEVAHRDGLIPGYKDTKDKKQKLLEEIFSTNPDILELAYSNYNDQFSISYRSYASANTFLRNTALVVSWEAGEAIKNSTPEPDVEDKLRTALQKPRKFEYWYAKPLTPAAK